MTGIVVTIHNRASLTRQTLVDLAATDFTGTLPLVILVDDCSTERECIQLIEHFTLPGIPVLKLYNSSCMGIKGALLRGIDFAFAYGCTVVTNLDNDVRLKSSWLQRILYIHQRHPNCICTGFHSTTRNRNGTERHRIIEAHDGYCKKASVGGINMLFNGDTYLKYIKPALHAATGNWDHMACLAAGGAMCITPSAIQHTGVEFSSLGHNQEIPDTAEGFETLLLSEVTLMGINCGAFYELENAANISMRDIKFGAVTLLTSDITTNPHAVPIQPVTSKEAYSTTVLRYLFAKVKTTHALIIQADGYVLNATAWQNDWLQYDYIGATWLYKDGMNVGNGGFSLRSRRLMETASLLLNAGATTHPEDHVICRTLRPALERNGIRFAPEEIANRFSIEAYGAEKLPGANRYGGQFGFHGWNVDFTNSGLLHIPRKQRYR